MGMHGYLHRVPPSQLVKMLAEPESIIVAIYPRDGVDALPECTVEKSWNAIEFILDRLAQAERIPWIGPLTEGESTGLELDYGPVWYRTPEQVRDLAGILSAISKEDFKRGYMPQKMAENSVYPEIWDRREEQEENFEYVWEWYTEMVSFYSEASDAGDAMLLRLG